MTSNKDITNELKKLRQKDKFADSAWEKRGLIPSSNELSVMLNASIDSCLDTLILHTEAEKSKEVLKKTLIGGLKNINKSSLDTEEKEFVADYFFQISRIVEVDFQTQLSNWLYGRLLTSLMKLKNIINPEKVIDTLKQHCTKCDAALETFVLKKEEGIPDYPWSIVQCNQCKEYNLLSYGPNIKSMRKGEYEYIEKLSKDEYTLEQAQTRLQQIRYFRNQ